eukprot:6173279-Pleurochrysis_carterae.AAC.1
MPVVASTKQKAPAVLPTTKTFLYKKPSGRVTEIVPAFPGVVWCVKWILEQCVAITDLAPPSPSMTQSSPSQAVGFAWTCLSNHENFRTVLSPERPAYPTSASMKQ